MIYRIRKGNRSLKGTVQLTPSKSISNRLLIIRELSPSPFQINNLATANDTLLLKELLKSSSEIIDAEDAGTTFRFLTALFAQKTGTRQLTGTARMKQRPIGILVDALRQLGAEIIYLEREQFPPLKITGNKLKGGKVEIDGTVSSQFISALLMVAPVLENGLILELKGEIVSQPYLVMTLKLMQDFGIHYEWKENLISIPHQKYEPRTITVESDWSAASYWFALAALAEDADLVLPGLQKDSMQGDAVIAKLMRQFGVETEFKSDGVRITKNKSVVLPEKFVYDFKAYPDLVQTMSVTCAALGVEAEFTGVQNLKLKETDRLKALQSALEKAGATTRISEFGFQISKSSLRTPNSALLTHKDHRMAMALALLALKTGEIRIEDPGVVNKSYPEFWEDLKSVGFEISKE